MKPDLLRVWLRVTMLWWLAAAVAWALSDQRIALSWAALGHPPVIVNAFNAARMAVAVLRRWSLLVALVNVFLFAAGAAGAWATETRRRRRQQRNLAADPEWRKVKITIGTLPLPDWLPRSLPASTIAFDEDLAASIQTMPEAHQRVMTEVLTYIKLHPEAYVGDGHKPDMLLIEHTINVLSALPAGEPDPLLPVLLAAHDMGKIKAKEQKKAKSGLEPSEGAKDRKATEDTKARVRAAEASREFHDDWSGLLLAAMPSFYDLPEADQRIAITALRFNHKGWRLPQLPDKAEQDRLAKLFKVVKELDGTATAGEHEETINELEDKDGLLRECFEICLHNDLIWQQAGLGRNAGAGGWRKDNRIYLSEPRLREALLHAMARIHPNAAIAWGEDRLQGQLARVTKELIRMLDALGWLVTVVEGRKALEQPLWIIKSGTVEFNAMLIVEPPSSLLFGIKDAPYEITVLRGQYGNVEVGPAGAMAATTANAVTANRSHAADTTAPSNPAAHDSADHIADPKEPTPSDREAAAGRNHRRPRDMTRDEIETACKAIAVRRGVNFEELQSAATSWQHLPIEIAYDAYLAPGATGKLPASFEHEQTDGDDQAADVENTIAEERYDNEPVSALAERYGITEDEVHDASGHLAHGRTIHEAIEVFLAERRTSKGA